MKKFERPIPIDNEIKLDPSRIIMSKTDARGVIEFANDYFMSICGYKEHELMGRPHSVVRHPDMPRVIFKILWDRLKNGENIHALVKNLAKDGSYYWVLTSFETKYDGEGNIISHYSRRKAAPSEAIAHIEKLYRSLIDIEKTQGMEVAEKYLIGLFEEKKTTFDAFMLRILRVDIKTLTTYFTEHNTLASKQKKKRFFGRFFK